MNNGQTVKLENVEKIGLVSQYLQTHYLNSPTDPPISVFCSWGEESQILSCAFSCEALLENPCK